MSGKKKGKIIMENSWWLGKYRKRRRGGIIAFLHLWACFFPGKETTTKKNGEMSVVKMKFSKLTAHGLKVTERMTK